MAQVRQHLQTLRLRHYRTVRAFAFACQFIGVHPDHQNITIRKSLFKITRMTLVEHVVNALRQHNTVAHALEIVGYPLEFLEIRNEAVFEIGAGRKDVLYCDTTLLHGSIESRILLLCNPAPVSSSPWAATGYSARITACFGTSRMTSNGSKP